MITDARPGRLLVVDLTGRVAVVIGAAGAIGAATARGLAGVEPNLYKEAGEATVLKAAQALFQRAPGHPTQGEGVRT